MNSVKYRRTKIVATLGPASGTSECIRKLIQAGVNVFRLNFSHGSREEHGRTLGTIRNIAAELNAFVAVLQDLSGPKIRITSLEGAPVPIFDGAEVELVHSDVQDKTQFSSSNRIFVETLNPAAVMKAGERALLADGTIELRAETFEAQVVKCRAVKGGNLRSRVGIAFPDSDIDLPATSDKDIGDFQWGLEHEVDYTAVSFVREASDLNRLRMIAQDKPQAPLLIAKIERPAALDNIEQILDSCDGIMVARGDLGVELPLEKVPHVQRDLIARANERGLPVIVATQMLQSMVTSIRPTRAEATDVAFAVMSGADAVMLSEETAIGENPVRCVEVLGSIALEAEHEMMLGEPAFDLKRADSYTISDAIAFATCAAAAKVEAEAVVACSASGTSARLVAKYRPEQPIFGVSSNYATLRRMALYWGVIPVPAKAEHSGETETQAALREIISKYTFSKDALAVVTVGRAVATPGSTNKLEIQKL